MQDIATQLAGAVSQNYINYFNNFKLKTIIHIILTNMTNIGKHIILDLYDVNILYSFVPDVFVK